MKTYLIKKIREKAKKEYDPKKFDELFLDIYLLSALVKPMASILSVVTGFYFLSVLFGAQSFGASKTLLAALVALIVESLKYYITPKAFQNLFKGNMAYGAPALAVSVPLYLISVFFTVSGAREYFEANNRAVKISVSQGNLTAGKKNAYYDSLIAHEQKKYGKLMEGHEGSKRLGWQSVIDQFNRIEKRIDLLNAEKHTEMTKTKTEARRLTDGAGKRGEKQKKYTLWIAASSEALLFISFLFGQFYLFTCWKGQKTAPNGKKRSVMIYVPLIKW